MFGFIQRGKVCLKISNILVEGIVLFDFFILKELIWTYV